MEINASAYLYSYGPIWLGWVIENNSDDATLYYDNCSVSRIPIYNKIVYMCVGLSKNTVFNKVKKFCLRRYTN